MSTSFDAVITTKPIRARRSTKDTVQRHKGKHDEEQREWRHRAPRRVKECANERNVRREGVEERRTRQAKKPTGRLRSWSADGDTLKQG
jgi:hypothetical protein